MKETMDSLIGMTPEEATVWKEAQVSAGKATVALERLVAALHPDVEEV